MPERIKRVRRKRRSRSLPGVETLSDFRLHLSPARFGIYLGIAALAILLIVAFGTYGSKLYTNWNESHLLKRASAALQEKNFRAADRYARQVLDRHRDSLP